MYFRLNPECYFIKGEKCGAIFDLIEGKIYSLNQEETEIVTSCEKNNPIQENIGLLNELKQLCLGNFYSNKRYMHKLRVGSPIEKDLQITPPEFFRAFIEINNECDKDCWFCGFQGIKRSSGCMGCNIWDENGESLTLERWKKIIDELKDLNCQEIFISGGDLTLEWDKTMEIVDYAYGKFVNIYITLQQQSLSEDIINDLENKTNLIIQTDNLKNIKSDNFNYLLVITPEHWDDVSKIEGSNIIKDFIVEEDSLVNLPHHKKEFPSLDLYQFISNMEYHPCMGHTLTICYNGNVIPCPMMRRSILGNVANKPLYTIFKERKGEIDKFWKLNLDEIENCTGCEFRYVCTDCRALEENITGRLNGKTLCNYNPKEGGWI